MLGPHCSLALYQHSSSQGESAISESRCWPPTVHLLFISIPALQRRSADSESKSWPPHYRICFHNIPAPRKNLQIVNQNRASHYHFCFHSIPAPKENLQIENQNLGSPLPPLFSQHSSSQLPRTACSSSFQVRAPFQNHCILQHSGSQGGSAVRLSKFEPPVETIVFNSIPAPNEGLQPVFPSSGSP